MINYQGNLTTTNGQLPSADYVLSFSIYDSATGGTRIWGPIIFDGVVTPGHGAKAPIVQGYFNVMLGPVDTNNRPISVAFEAPHRWLEISVESNIISPRQQILSTPFAMQAARAETAIQASTAVLATNSIQSANSDKLSGHDWSVLFGNTDPLKGSISGKRLSDRTIPPEKLEIRPIDKNAQSGGMAVFETLNDTTTSTTPVDLIHVKLNTTGRPVMIMLTGMGGDSYESGSKLFKQGSGGVAVWYRLFRDGTPLVTWKQAIASDNFIGWEQIPVSWSYLDIGGSNGEVTYTIKWFVAGASAKAECYGIRLVAYEP